MARSTGWTCSIANALKIGLPAFISEFRTAMAVMTVHSTGENPRTTRNGMLQAWTMTTEVICPNRRASHGWARIASTVPSEVSAKTALSCARSRPNLRWMYRLRNGMTWPAPMEMSSPGNTSFANRARSRIVIPRSVRERRGSAGKAAGSPSRRSREATVRDGRSSVMRVTLNRPSTESPSMITRITLYTPGPPAAKPSAPATNVATTPPRIAAAMLVAFWIANWRANSSLRCSGSLCSVMNGEITTWKAWNPMDHRAAARMTTISASDASSATSATMPAMIPAKKIVRRPSRSDAALAGKAMIPPASDARVETSPIVAVVYPSETRYRLKSIHHRLVAAPVTTLVTRISRASRWKRP